MRRNVDDIFEAGAKKKDGEIKDSRMYCITLEIYFFPSTQTKYQDSI